MAYRIIPGTQPKLSGERFKAQYLLTGAEADARGQAEEIRYEQTVEFPGDLTPSGPISDGVVGRIETFEASGPGQFLVTISYAVETVGSELTQLLNVLFGNSSIKPGIRLMGFELPEKWLKKFRGPRFGRAGLRQRFNAPQGALLSTALKPMGLAAEDLAQLAYLLALGGLDIIKDDHGLADQPFAPFEKRVALCAKAVARANQESGFRTVYAPHISAGPGTLEKRAAFAREVGAGALLLSPGIVGFDAMRSLADDDRLALPILCHPALLGSFVTSPTCGIEHGTLFGSIARLAGADATIFPNFGGRFAFSKEECRRIAEASAAPMGSLKTLFPMPGGGMSLDRIPEMMEVYGGDLIFLIGGGLFRHGADLVENARHFRKMAGRE